MKEFYAFIAKNGYPSYPPLEQAISSLCELLEGSGSRWLLGGSCGLWLQGVELAAPPRDIDIYADLDDAKMVHDGLESLAVDEPVMDRSGIYVSRLSHYQVADCSAELVGGFEVHAKGLDYQVQVNDVLLPCSPRIAEGLRVMPLAHELVFNMLRERSDRVEAIAKRIRLLPDPHVRQLQELAQQNGWTKEQVLLLDRELGNPGWFVNLSAEPSKEESRGNPYHI